MAASDLSNSAVQRFNGPAVNTVLRPTPAPAPATGNPGGVTPAPYQYGDQGANILANGTLPKAGPGETMATTGQALQDTFLGAIDDERRRRAALAGQEDASGATTDKAIQNVASLSPTANDATPIGTANYTPGATEGVNFDALKNVDLTPVTNYQNTALNGLGDAGSDLTKLASQAGGIQGNATGFDAGAAYQQYAGGAISDLMQNQKLALKDLAAKSVGAGRLNTGFFDQDQGSVMQELTRGATSDLAEQAVSAAGITATAHSAADATNERAMEAGLSTADSALSQAATLRFNTANAKDSNTLDAAKTGATLGLTQGQDLAGDQLTRASTIDADTLDATKSTDALNLNKAQYSDTYRANAATAAAGESQARTDQLSSDSNQASNRYLDALTGGINMLQGQKNAKDASSSNFLSGLLGAAGGIGGFILGGPAGAAVGAKAGSALG